MKDILPNPINTLQLLTTGDCNQNCSMCTQVKFLADYAGYHASLESVEKICRRSKKIGANYIWFQLSGGEPLLWKNLEMACELAKSLGPFKRIKIFTNCSDPRRLFNLLDSGLIDLVLTERYNSNAEAIEVLSQKYADKVIIEDRGHRPLPIRPVSNSLPAGCRCSILDVLENNVFPCGNFYAQIYRLGYTLKDYRKYYCTLDDNWIQFMKKVNRFRMDICRYCLGNRKIVSYNQNKEIRI